MKKDQDPRIVVTIRSNPCLRELFMNSEKKIRGVRGQSSTPRVRERVDGHAKTRKAILWPDGKLSTLHT